MNLLVTLDPPSIQTLTFPCPRNTTLRSVLVGASYSGVALRTHAGRDRNAYFPSRCGSVDELNSKNVNVAVADVGDHFHVPVSWIGPTALCIRLVTIRDIVRE